jgi:hypothetical protein
MPLFARLEDQVAWLGDHHGIPEQRPDAAFEDEAAFVLAVVPVHRSRRCARLHRVLDERKTFAGIFPANEEASAGPSKNRKMAVSRAENSRCCHGGHQPHSRCAAGTSYS